MFRKMMLVTTLFMCGVLAVISNAQQPTDPQNPSRTGQRGSSQSGQSQSGQSQSSQSTDRSRTDNNRTQSDRNNTTRQDNNQSQSGNTSSQQNNKISSDDREFAMKAAEGGQAEVAHAQMALQKSASDDVKRYAQRMIDDHTKANQELMTIASGKGLTLPGNMQSMHSAHAQMHGNTASTSTDTTGSTNTAGASRTINPRSTTGATNPNTESSGDMRKTEPAMNTKMSKDHQMAMDRLSKLSGAEFDREYIKMDLKDHKKTIELFEKQARSGRDAELKAFAEKTLPTLREHHQMARDIAGKVGVAAEGPIR
jgi:putative membrane protein